ncbi:MAG: hypothetical protein OQL28_10235 [Sedimenticola sp.]|nr:hypothetical protein [Sedimenticola sp.]
MKPTDDELSVALQRAEAMRDQGDDPEYLARSLLYLARRDELLEEILEHLELYLGFGFPEEEHARLVLLVEQARRQARVEQGESPDKLGL